MRRPRSTRAHAEYFFHKLLYTPQYYQAIPGCLEYGALVQAMQNPARAVDLRALKATRISSSAASSSSAAPRPCASSCSTASSGLRIGHLLALLHFGSMPTELCRKNIDLFCREVLPHLEDLWDDEWEDRWWPERLQDRSARSGPGLAAAS